jgi:PAS domain S-box-containing protein
MFAQKKIKLLIVLVSVCVYVSLFYTFVYLKLPGAAIFAVIPVAVFAMMYGWRAGLVAGLLSQPVDIVLYASVGVDWYEYMTGGGAPLAGTAAIIFLGLIIGRMSELSSRLSRELKEKQRIEQELKLHRENLEQLVDSRTHELRDSQARFKAVAENYPDVIIITDARGVILYANESLKKIFGYGPYELLGTSSIVLLPERLREAEHKKREFLFGKGVQNGITATIESTMLRKDGSEFPVEFSLYSWEMHDASFFATVIRDISDRRRAADELKAAYEELQRSRDFFQNVFNAAGDGMYVTDDLGTIEFANSAVHEMLGYEPGELIGKSGMDITADVPGMESDPALENMIYYTDYDQTFETFFLRKDGSRVPVESRVTNVQEGQQASPALIFILRDITQRKQAEDEIHRARDYFESILKTSPDAVFVVNDEGIIVMANESVYDIHGYRPEELVGTHVTTLAVVDEIAFERSYAMMEQLNDEGIVRNVACEHVRKDGTIIQVEASHALLRNPDGTVSGSISSIRDVTQRKRIEGQLRQSQKMEAMGTLAGGIAHDFNNILAAIIGYTELSRDIVADEHIRRNLDQVLLAADRAKNLVRQILTFSRKAEPERKPLLVHTVVREALKLMRSTVPKTIQIQSDIVDVPQVIVGDTTEVHQVVMNLCTNSVHAMQENGGLLRVGLDAVDISPASSAAFNDMPPGRYVRLSLSDTGTGIPPEICGRIFDPFFTTKAVDKGTGMGLAVVHGIVKSYGGEITVDSTPGKGTLFTVLLPCFDDTVAEVENFGSPALPRGSERILLVEDEDLIIECMQAQLSSLGYEVSARQDVREALAEFQKNPEAFDLVITDQTMPHMTGDRFACSILALRPGIPIIMCTGFSEKIDEASARALGIQGFVMKPAGVREIAQAVRALLDASR